jgi:hypothetical protein
MCLNVSDRSHDSSRTALTASCSVPTSASPCSASTRAGMSRNTSSIVEQMRSRWWLYSQVSRPLAMTYQLPISLLPPLPKDPAHKLPLLHPLLPVHPVPRPRPSPTPGQARIIVPLQMDIPPERLIGILPPISRARAPSPSTQRAHLVDDRSKLFTRPSDSRDRRDLVPSRHAEHLMDDLQPKSAQIYRRASQGTHLVRALQE